MIFEKLQSIVAEQMNIDKADITLQTNIIDDLGADSLDIVELLMNVEAEWNIEVDDSEVADIKTVGDVVSFIQRKAK